jgi:hypothetical protein
MVKNDGIVSSIEANWFPEIGEHQRVRSIIPSILDIPKTGQVIVNLQAIDGPRKFVIADIIAASMKK